MEIGNEVRQSLKNLTKGLDGLGAVLEATKKELKVTDAEEVEKFLKDSGAEEKIEELRQKVERLSKR